MKRFLLIGLLVLALTAMTACSNGEESKPEPSTKGEASSSEPGTQLPNPVVEYETPDFRNAAGFSIELPDEVSYQSCQLIDCTVAQLGLDLDGEGEAVLRVAAGTGTDISGVYEEFESTSTVSYNGVDVTLKEAKDGPSLAAWEQGGYTFSLYIKDAPAGTATGLLKKLPGKIVMSPETAPESAPSLPG